MWEDRGTTTTTETIEPSRDVFTKSVDKTIGTDEEASTVNATRETSVGKSKREIEDEFGRNDLRVGAMMIETGEIAETTAMMIETEDVGVEIRRS